MDEDKKFTAEDLKPYVIKCLDHIKECDNDKEAKRLNFRLIIKAFAKLSTDEQREYVQKIAPHNKRLFQQIFNFILREKLSLIGCTDMGCEIRLKDATENDLKNGLRNACSIATWLCNVSIVLLDLPDSDSFVAVNSKEKK